MTVLPLIVKFVKERPTAKLPTKGSEWSAGSDLYAAEPAMVDPGQTKLVSTGLRMELPTGYEAQVRPRSGLALKHSVTVLNSPGTIDSDFRGVIGVVLHNHGSEIFNIEQGDRIAQLVIQPCIMSNISLVEVDELSDTERGSGGFGSTGV